MRVVSYNILDGGLGRADPIAEILVAQQADVICLIEADDDWVLDRLARRLGMDRIVGQARRHNVAIFSRWPIRGSWNYAPMLPATGNPFLLAEVLSPAGRALPIAAVHLHPRASVADEVERMGQIRAVLGVLAKIAGPHLLAGDLNSNSPIQQIDPARCKPRTQKDYQANGGMLPREAISHILRSGYVDTLEAARGPSAGTMGSFSTHHPGQRVDYIFAHGIDRSAVTSAWIETDRLAEYASDHFPIGAEIAGW